MEERIASFLDLNVWKKAHQLVLDVYQITSHFPEKETTLNEQLKLTAVAVAAEIAEGFQIRLRQEKGKYYQDAQIKLTKVHYLLILTQDLGYADTHVLLENMHEIQRMLGGLLRSVLGNCRNGKVG